MADVAALKAAAQREVEQVSRMLIGCSDWMAENPELGLQEYQASAKLTEMLEEFGAEVERGIAGLDTAFRATLPGGNPDGPTIAIIAEYDALPDVGHGCGHNIIANAAIGAGIALARLGQQGLLPGRVIILGTPAEESAVPNAGGKIPVLEHGYFDGVDAAIMIHPQTEDFIALKPSMVAYGIDFMFHGRAAHAAANPHTGINALDAVIQTFNNVGMLRQQMRSEARIHGVVTSGGGAPNVIPPYAACRFRIRSYDPVYAAELKQRVSRLRRGGRNRDRRAARMEGIHQTVPELRPQSRTRRGDAREYGSNWPGRAGWPSTRGRRLDRLRQCQSRSTGGLRLHRHLRRGGGLALARGRGSNENAAWARLPDRRCEDDGDDRD